MLAKNQIPASYEEWNRRHGSPFGRPGWRKLTGIRGLGGLAWRRRFRLPGPVQRWAGPFAYQPNSETRAFEYAWCFEAAELKPGMEVLDIGAGAAGFQFVLAGEGCRVTSVDPLISPPGESDWIFTEEDFERLNRSFGGGVRFVRAFLEDARLPAASFDRVFSVSVIEHIPPGAVPGLMREIGRLLKPGGRFVATIDLFLDIRPFAPPEANKWGTNIDVRALVEHSGLSMIVGDPRELHGYPEFSPDRVRADLGRYLVVNGVLTQCIVLEKR